MIHWSILIFLLWLCGCKTMWWILYCIYTVVQWVVFMIICCFIKCIAFWIAFVRNICYKINHIPIPSICIILTTLRDWGIRASSRAVIITVCVECVVVSIRARSTVGYAYAYTYTYTYFTLHHFTSHTLILYITLLYNTLLYTLHFTHTITITIYHYNTNTH